MASKRVGILVGVGLSVFVGCGGSGGDGTESGAGAQTVGSAAPATAAGGGSWEGTYVVDAPNFGGTLTIKGAQPPFAFDLVVNAKKGASATGVIKDGKAAPVGAFAEGVPVNGPVKPTYFDGGCSIVFTRAADGNSLDLADFGHCSGFGAGLDNVSGTYTKSNGASPPPETVPPGVPAGLYTADGDNIAWALRVKGENDEAFYTFEVAAGFVEEDPTHVDTGDQLGADQGGPIEFQGADPAGNRDCTIVVSNTPNGIHVKQTGTCASIGFPAQDSLNMGERDFVRVDETKSCFDKKFVGVAALPCQNPL
jgi:hypothetical protein